MTRRQAGFSSADRGGRSKLKWKRARKAVRELPISTHRRSEGAAFRTRTLKNCEFVRVSRKGIVSHSRSEVPDVNLTKRGRRLEMLGQFICGSTHVSGFYLPDYRARLAPGRSSRLCVPVVELMWDKLILPGQGNVWSNSPNVGGLGCRRRRMRYLGDTLHCHAGLRSRNQSWL
jgi:hypothetical protein